VTRRADPERIYLARRAATFRRLVDVDHFDELAAEHWIARWEREADAQDVPRLTAEFWDAGGRWIRDRRSARNGSGGR
jgi:hypothetical protein